VKAFSSRAFIGHPWPRKRTRICATCSFHPLGPVAKACSVRPRLFVPDICPQSRRVEEQLYLLAGQDVAVEELHRQR
jgi:hypothetical protein